MREDLRTWLSFLNSHNGVTLLYKHKWHSSEKLSLYTDAAKSKGYGAIFGSQISACPIARDK